MTGCPLEFVKLLANGKDGEHTKVHGTIKKEWWMMSKYPYEMTREEYRASIDNCDEETDQKRHEFIDEYCKYLDDNEVCCVGYEGMQSLHVKSRPLWQLYDELVAFAKKMGKIE
jgi:hypothetical protein